jgi:hypothetical protein
MLTPILIGFALLELAGADVAAGAGAPQAAKSVKIMMLTTIKFIFLTNMGLLLFSFMKVV